MQQSSPSRWLSAVGRKKCARTRMSTSSRELRSARGGRPGELGAKVEHILFGARGDLQFERKLTSRRAAAAAARRLKEAV